MKHTNIDEMNNDEETSIKIVLRRSLFGIKEYLEQHLSLKKALQLEVSCHP